MMTPETVRAFGRDGFDIGAHTVNHPILATQSADEARFEVQASRDWVARVTGAAPVSFAYPNGRPGRDYDDSTRPDGSGCRLTSWRSARPGGAPAAVPMCSSFRGWPSGTARAGRSGRAWSRRTRVPTPARRLARSPVAGQPALQQSQIPDGVAEERGMTAAMVLDQLVQELSPDDAARLQIRQQ